MPAKKNTALVTSDKIVEGPIVAVQYPDTPNYTATDSAIAELDKKYSHIKDVDPKDSKAVKELDAAISDVSSFRTQNQKEEDVIKKPLNAFRKVVIDLGKKLRGDVLKIEDRLKVEKKRVTRFLADEEAAKAEALRVKIQNQQQHLLDINALSHGIHDMNTVELCARMMEVSKIDLDAMGFDELMEDAVNALASAKEGVTACLAQAEEQVKREAEEKAAKLKKEAEDKATKEAEAEKDKKMKEQAELIEKLQAEANKTTKKTYTTTPIVAPSEPLKAPLEAVIEPIEPMISDEGRQGALSIAYGITVMDKCDGDVTPRVLEHIKLLIDDNLDMDFFGVLMAALPTLERIISSYTQKPPSKLHEMFKIGALDGGNVVGALEEYEGWIVEESQKLIADRIVTAVHECVSDLDDDANRKGGVSQSSDYRRNVDVNDPISGAFDDGVMDGQFLDALIIQIKKITDYTNPSAYKDAEVVEATGKVIQSMKNAVAYLSEIHARKFGGA